jgi:GAF domain-containing protein/ANTAR domain-containing protein
MSWPGGSPVAELGVVTRALLAIARDGVDDRVLAMRICRACVAGLHVDGAAISLLTGSVARQILAATDATAELLEDLQFTLNEGACMEAASTGSPVLVADLRQSSEVAPWPVFAAAVLERSSVRALFALPLQWGAVNLGVLDLYRLEPGALDDEQLRDAISSADTAALMILGLRTDPDHRGAGWLDHAVAHRAEVHQATGMVSVQLDVSATEALARMRAHAFVHNQLLTDVAREVVARQLAFTEDTE